MARRTSLAANVTPAKKAKEAAATAKAIARQPVPQNTATGDVECETVSYNLPLHLIDLYRDLAERRHRVDQAQKRELRRQIKAAKRAGLPLPKEVPPQARQSASAIVREAMEAYADTVRAEIQKLGG